ncbi:hypothetical protein [Idiomarina xiamenensis]|uniref:Uncharacterized protein n=1 Tax=Idiomarina xiamenensis 10-D-4 TaxID=740709 RepID=K2K8Q9_9GAMM|nr:hypothetical protein [Idiomarina xiamenensis]EKE82952.1 hypothetical protein A10D4_08934 [Idiomarina xiamenensis 10-D-4]
MDHRSLAGCMFGLLTITSAVAAEPAQQKATDNQQQQEKDGDQAWLDDFRSGLNNSVDATARWLDDFFGDKRSFDDSQGSTGRLSVAPQWDQYDGFEVDTSLRAKVRLPQAEQRFSAFFGSDGEDDLRGPSSARRSVVRSSRDDDWLLGFGFDPYLHDGNPVSFSVGVRGGIHLDPYTRARYRFDLPFNDNHQLRARSDAFWRDSDGFGVEQYIDIEQQFSSLWLGRWSLHGKFAERTKGLEWYNGYTIFYLYDEQRAISSEFWLYGQTDNEAETLNDYGFRVNHRQQLWREWFYIETWAGLHWPRYEFEDHRSAKWMLGIEFELHFGADYYD